MSTPPKNGKTANAPAVQIVRVDEASISDSEAMPQVPDKTNPDCLKIGNSVVKNSVANTPPIPDEISNGSSDVHSYKENTEEKEKEKPKPVAIAANQANPVPPVSQASTSASNATVSVTGSDSIDMAPPTVVSIASNGSVSMNTGTKKTTLNSTPLVTSKMSTSTASSFSQGSSNSSSAASSDEMSSSTGTKSSSAASSESASGKASTVGSTMNTPVKHPSLPNTSLSTSMSSYVSKNHEELGTTYVVNPKDAATYIVNHASESFSNLMSHRPWSDFRAKHQKQAEELRQKAADKRCGPLATSTPRSGKSGTIPISSNGRNVGSVTFKKSTSDITVSNMPSLSLSARAFTPSESSDATSQQNSFTAFERDDETHAMRIKHLLEYVINNVKDLDRVACIRISVERAFPEIKSTEPSAADIIKIKQ